MKLGNLLPYWIICVSFAKKKIKPSDDITSNLISKTFTRESRKTLLYLAIQLDYCQSKEFLALRNFSEYHLSHFYID